MMIDRTASLARAYTLLLIAAERTRPEAPTNGGDTTSDQPEPNPNPPLHRLQSNQSDRQSPTYNPTNFEFEEIEEMTSTDELFPSKYLKVADIDETGGDLVLTVTGWSMEEIGEDREQKPCLHFHETTKTLVLNKTNCKTIEGMYGKVIENWKGKKIQLYTTEVAFAGKTQLGIRIRMRAPVVAKPTPQPSAQGVPDDVNQLLADADVFAQD